MKNFTALKYITIVFLLYGFYGWAHEKENVKRIDSALVAINQTTATVPLDSTITLMDEFISLHPKEEYPIAYGRGVSLKSWFVVGKANYEESVRLGHQALEIQREISDSSGIAQTLLRIGIANFQLNRVEDGFHYMEQALDYFIVLKDTHRLEVVYNNLGVFSSESGNPERAISYYEKSLQIRKNLNKTYWVAYSYFNIAEAYGRMETWDMAVLYYDKALDTFRSTKSRKVPAMVYDGLALLNIQMGQKEEALKHSLLSYKIAKEQKRDEIIVHSTETLSKAYLNVEDYENAYKYQQEFIDLKFRIDSLNNVTQVSEIEEKFKNKERLQEITQLKNQQLEDQNKIQNLQLWILYLVIGGLILFALIGLYYLRRIQKQKLEQEQTEKHLAELKLMALQSQMNPHFIFNCINTVQSFVVNSQKAEAYEYLANFAKLLRLVLNNSRKANIALEDEIRQIELYVQLEAIRFEGQFEYEIYVDTELQNGVYEIPGMMIQSLAENAIIHGLNNLSERKGRLEINFLKSGEVLRCEIVDNGVGRTRALEIKQNKSTYYPSIALPNIKERIELLKNTEYKAMTLEIEDLYEGGQAMGTKVMLFLPLM